ncbi:sugar ABC transporter permease [Azospirillum sp. RWY-5-1]|uniref:Sugar ABC transporter permease n=2 Tax=Azospirillum oleiclasticum TaxID=2735135 RepID=A0ABX2T2H6_9PROT|nr:sugar ABC transporter permease [Azospirillum oleiclasticum]NYZ11105.1 sugar ABC transporter permease [Azospirillum oleiclasticum]NYZ18267.1 sugar ABC transporter permease [Azospirillum oleiclasticum]
MRRRAVPLFVLPMAAVLALVAGWPLARTLWFSLTDATLATLDDHAVIGLENYYWLGLDPVWWRAVGNTLLFAGVSVTLETALGFALALVLNRRLPLRGVLRAVVLIPWAIPTVVSAQMWAWMLHDLYGVVNTILLALGLIAAPLAWTADPALALPAVIAVDVWKSTPFMTLLILAALQLVPGELYEAARVDGVPAHRVFLDITLPLVWPAVMVAVIFRTLDALRVFDLMYVLTGNSRETMSMSVYARQHLIEFQDVGYGSAASSALVLVVALVTALAITAGRLRLGDGEPER